MSGIVGILNFDGAPVDPELLGQLTGSLAYRGPDAQDLWMGGPVGLGHTLLRTTFEAASEKQPHTLNGKTWLTADARIDGRSDLLQALEARLSRDLQIISHGSRRLPNDAELILLAYEAWGEQCVDHLLGDFAFAIWDVEQRKLFCARDHFGVKPLYYSHFGDVFLFSNTLNCLRLHPRVSPTLNEVAIGDYLLFGINQDPATTTFRDIQRLPPATTLAISKTRSNQRQYWSAPEKSHIRFRKRSEYVDQFCHLFSQAVCDRLRTGKVSVSMSGGLDSTSVAAVARDHSELRSYVVVYDHLIPDKERHFSSLAASALNIPITHIAADDYSLYQHTFPHELKQPEPFLVNPTAGQFNELLRSMADHSRVALSGWDGDALMNEPAHTTFAASARDLQIKQLVTDLCWFLSQRRLPPIGVRNRLKRLFGSSSNSHYFPEWIDASFSQRLNLQGRWKEISSKPENSHRTRPRTYHALNLQSWTGLFEGYDPGTSRLLLEVRHPLIDLRLVEFLLSIPVIPWCIEKEILRSGMEGKLPEEIRARPKTPLSGFPALRLVEKSSVRFIDHFEPARGLSRFVNLAAQYRVEGERDIDKLWANLRAFGLNHWLTHSLPSVAATSQAKVHHRN